MRTLEENKRRQELEIGKLNSEIRSLGGQANVKPPTQDSEQLKATLIGKQGDLAAKQEDVEKLMAKIRDARQKMEPNSSKGFINDILSDDEGISFHRFQMMAWTIVLMIIFVWCVISHATMPDFDTTLLGLMGISGGTFVGFKLPTQQG